MDDRAQRQGARADRYASRPAAEVAGEGPAVAGGHEVEHTVTAVAGTARNLFPNGWAAKTNPTILSDLSPSVQFEKVVEACGGYGQRIDDPAEVPAALERALHAVRVEKRQALINFVSAPMTGPRF